MPHDWNASLRVAQMENAAKNYDEAVAACDRGLSRTPGALGRSWLLRTKADALSQTGHGEEARRLLEEALQAAQAIPNTHSRDSDVNRIKQALEQPTREDQRQKN